MGYLMGYYLVGGWPTPLKNMTSSAGIILPNVWKVKIQMFQTTKQLSYGLKDQKTYEVYRSQVNFEANCTDPSPIHHSYWRKTDRRYHQGVPHFVCSGKIKYFEALRLRWQSFYELLFRHVGIKPTRYILIQVNGSIKVVWRGRNPD